MIEGRWLTVLRGVLLVVEVTSRDGLTLRVVNEGRHGEDGGDRELEVLQSIGVRWDVIAVEGNLHGYI